MIKNHLSLKKKPALIRLIWKRLFGINNLATWINALNQNPNQIEQIFGSQLQKCCLTYSRSTFQWAAHAFYFLLHEKMEYIFLCIHQREKKIAEIEFSITSCFHNEIICCINNFITNSLVIAIQWWFFCCSVGAHILYFTTAYAFFIYLNRIACHSNWPCFFFNSLACLLSSLLSKVF